MGRTSTTVTRSRDRVRSVATPRIGARHHAGVPASVRGAPFGAVEPAGGGRSVFVVFPFSEVPS